MTHRERQTLTGAGIMAVLIAILGYQLIAIAPLPEPEPATDDDDSGDDDSGDDDSSFANLPPLPKE